MNDSCLKIANTFHKKFGIYISDYFVVLDSLSIDLNTDNVIDRVIMVSPLSLEASADVKCQGQDTRGSHKIFAILIRVVCSKDKKYNNKEEKIVITGREQKFRELWKK